MSLFRLAGTLIVIAIVGPLAWNFIRIEDRDLFVSITAFSIGVLTFFGVSELNRSTERGKVLSEETLRTAIASSLLTTYLFIVCFTSFVRTADTAGTVTQAFVQSFSQVISVTIAFYFGATTATQIFGKRGDAGQHREGDERK
jgi:hypothetical protein